jgi:rubrerythrin
MFTWKEIIDIAVQIEHNGERIYRRAAEQINNPFLSAALLKMADEEAKHAKWISRLRPPRSRLPGDSNLEKIVRVFMRETVVDKTFSLKEADFRSMKAVEDLFETSIEFERDTILFYETIRRIVSEDETITLLDTIIAEEKNHITTLQVSIKSA